MTHIVTTQFYDRYNEKFHKIIEGEELDIGTFDQILSDHVSLCFKLTTSDAANAHTLELHKKIKNLDAIFKHKHIINVDFYIFDQRWSSLNFTTKQMDSLKTIMKKWCTTKDTNATIDALIEAGLEDLL